MSTKKIISLLFVWTSAAAAEEGANNLREQNTRMVNFDERDFPFSSSSLYLKLVRE